MKNPMKKVAVAAACAALAMPVAAVSTSANAGTAPPPCKNRPLKKAIKQANGTTVKITGKACVDYWAAAQYDVQGEFDAASMFEANGGAWKVVGAKREAKLCKPSNKTVPNKVKKMACVS